MPSVGGIWAWRLKKEPDIMSSCALCTNGLQVLPTVPNWSGGIVVGGVFLALDCCCLALEINVEGSGSERQLTAFCGPEEANLTH